MHAGADNLDAIAAALRSSAATYAAEDAAGMHRLREFSLPAGTAVARDPGMRGDIGTLVQDVRSGLDEAAAASTPSPAGSTRRWATCPRVRPSPGDQRSPTCVAGSPR